MRFASLGSGSEGNGLLIEAGPADRPVRLLLDCGFGLKEALRRLERLGVAATDLAGILVTHEHGDHLGGVFRLARHAGLGVWMTRGTFRASAMELTSLEAAGVSWHVVDPHDPFEFSGVCIEPIAVPHDAREPVQYVIDDGSNRLGVLTDLGHPTAHVQRALSRLDCLVLECNHDVDLLAASDYPGSLKRRVGGDYGHLSNRQAEQLLAALDHSRLRQVVAAHLSRQNNRPELARESLARAWGTALDAVRVADQDNGLDWITV